jgi:2-methylisocitrate lyase-like PEP mutase family enzyme
MNQSLENAPSVSQRDKAELLQALHRAPGAFVIPNPWDGGSARLLAAHGFKALATSSAATAAVMGRRDHRISRADALASAKGIVDATDLPVSADLENGFGDAPEVVAETIRLAAEAGLVGGSIEDGTANAAKPLYDLPQAVERVKAAVQAARALPFPFTLTARAEGFICGRPDLEDVIRRLKAYEEVGADVLFAPGLPNLDAVRAVCAAVRKPVNFMNGMKGNSYSVAELTAAGVKRISLAMSLYRAAMTGLRDAAREVSERGTFGYAETAMESKELAGVLRS